MLGVLAALLWSALLAVCASLQISGGLRRVRTVRRHAIGATALEEDDAVASTRVAIGGVGEITLLQQRPHGEHGHRASIPGTLWPGSIVLAEYISNPFCLETWDGKTVVELGAGLGLGSIAAGLAGARVTATDLFTTVSEQYGEDRKVDPGALLRANLDAHAHRFKHPPSAANLMWGDAEAVATLPRPDIIIASDVVYPDSAREPLRATIEALCPAGSDAVVLIAHRWRLPPGVDEEYFASFDALFERSEIPAWMLPPAHREPTADGRLPIAIHRLARRNPAAGGAVAATSAAAELAAGSAAAAAAGIRASATSAAATATCFAAHDLPSNGISWQHFGSADRRAAPPAPFRPDDLARISLTPLLSAAEAAALIAAADADWIGWLRDPNDRYGTAAARAGSLYPITERRCDLP